MIPAHRSVIILYATLITVKGLISEKQLEEMSSKDLEPINEKEAKLMMKQTEILLITANQNEYNAVIYFLKPRGAKKELLIYDFDFSVGFLKRNTRYVFGRFGMCNVAVHSIPKQGPAAAQSAIITAASCFENLAAIFAVGVACGVKKKTKLLDVIIAEKVSFYTDARLSTQDGKLKIKPRAPRDLSTSKVYRLKFTMTKPKWSKHNSVIMKCLSDEPKMYFKNVLSGNYLIDNEGVQETLLNTFASDAYAIEMEIAGLFHDYGDHNVQLMLVKAVCDYGDGSKNKEYQPTAALLAAECVHYYLSKGKSLSYFM